jgi:hypothetical protein
MPPIARYATQRVGGTPEPSSGAAVVVTVERRIATRAEWRIHRNVVLVSPLIFLPAVFLTIGGAGVSLLGKLVVATVALVAFDLLMLEIRAQPRVVILSPVGVILRYKLHAERGSWKDFDEKVRQVRGALAGDGGWWVRRRATGPTGSRILRAHWLTDQQAQALVQFPSGKTWTTEPASAASGLLGGNVQPNSRSPAGRG